MPHGKHARPGTTAKAVAAGTAAAGGAALAGTALLSAHASATALHPAVTPVRRTVPSYPTARPATLDALRVYTVAGGDYLSAIAARQCGTAGDWTGIYAANRALIGANPDLIVPGQVLTVSCTAPAAPPGRVAGGGDHEPDGDSDDPAPSSGGGSGGGYGGNGYAVTSAFQACVITRESGGNPWIWNASGHWGLYQFSYDTWVAAGGAPGAFGHSGGGYQTQVFWDAYNLWGTSPWQPYDGCL